MKVLALLLCLPLTGCGALCALIGDYQGVYSGDASGEFTLSIEDGGEKEDPTANLDFNTGPFEEQDASASGTIGCEDGQLVLDIYVGGEAVGSLEGTMDGSTGSGHWETDDGLSGDWEMQ